MSSKVPAGSTPAMPSKQLGGVFSLAHVGCQVAFRCRFPGKQIFSPPLPLRDDNCRLRLGICGTAGSRPLTKTSKQASTWRICWLIHDDSCCFVCPKKTPMACSEIRSRRASMLKSGRKPSQGHEDREYHWYDI